MTDEAKRAALWDRVEAGRERLAGREIARTAREAADAASGFVKRHPIATLGGAIAVGLAIGAMTRRGRQLGRRGGALAGVVADVALTYGLKLIDELTDVARQGQDRIEDFGDDLEDTARSARRDASYLAGKVSDKTRAAARNVSHRASRAVRDMRSRKSG